MAFGRCHRPGQVVVGRVLEALDGNLARLEVDGFVLVAVLNGPAVPGRSLRLRVEAVLPRIVLKDLSAPSSAASEMDLIV